MVGNILLYIPIDKRNISYSLFNASKDVAICAPFICLDIAKPKRVSCSRASGWLLAADALSDVP